MSIKVGASSEAHSFNHTTAGIVGCNYTRWWGYIRVSAVSVSCSVSAGIEMGRSSVQERLRII